MGVNKIGRKYNGSRKNWLVWELNVRRCNHEVRTLYLLPSDLLLEHIKERVHVWNLGW